MIDFGGNSVVITGAAGGIGRALVACFAECGAWVVACDLSGTDLSAPGVAERYAFDQSDDTQLANVADAVVAEGPVDSVIATVGWTRAESLDEVSADMLTNEINLNLRSAARLSQVFLPAMRTSGYGTFVFISSVNGIAHYGNPAYSAAKAGLLGWMRSLACEEGRYGIRANAIAPGSTRTPAWDHRIERDPAIIEKVAQLYPIGRIIEPIEVARAAAFLASSAASGISGATLTVDGGLTAGNLSFIQHIVE